MWCKTALQTAITALLVATLVADSGPVHAQMTGLNPTPAEISMLPKFCLEQMGAASGQSAWAVKPIDCGPFTNHYCPGLVWLLRAKRQTDPKRALQMLASVEQDVRYTKDGTAKYPYCSIRAHVNATELEVKKLRQAFEARARLPKAPR